jgi:hypothetical protein
MGKRSIFLHQDHDVLDVLNRAGLDLCLDRQCTPDGRGK